MDMSINQRLANFLYEKKISQEELRIKLGLKTRQQVSNWLNCRDHIPDKHLMGIIRLFPELNANWLIREIGSPLIDQKSANQSERIRFLRGMFGKRQRNRNPENPTTQERRRNREKRKRDARILPGIRENGRTSIPIRKSISTKRMYPLE